MPTAEERQMIRQAAAGDPIAIQKLLLDHHDAIAALINRKLPADLRGLLSPDDVAQEAYVAALRQLGTFDAEAEGSFRSWLLTIAEHKLIDLIRWCRADKRGGGRAPVGFAADPESHSAILALEQLATHSRTPSRSAAGVEAVEAVQQALDSLPSDYQAALRHRYLEGLSVRQTAEILKRTEGAVMMLCHRGLALLSDALRQSQFFSRRA